MGTILTVVVTNNILVTHLPCPENAQLVKSQVSLLPEELVESGVLPRLLLPPRKPRMPESESEICSSLPDKELIIRYSQLGTERLFFVLFMINNYLSKHNCFFF